MIIETNSGLIYSVTETNDQSLAHCWNGQRVKRSGGAYVPVKKIMIELVRKAGSTVVAL